MFGLKRYFWAATSFGLAFKNVGRKKKKKRRRLNLKEQNILGWKKKCFWTEKKGTRELKRNKRRRLDFSKRVVLKAETKGGKEQRCWSWKKEKGWNRKKEKRCGAEAERKRGLEQRIFQHLLPFNSSQKIMVNSFMLNLIFSMN